MNIAKNMEFILAVTIALATVTGAAKAGVQAHQASKKASVQLVEASGMTVVTVTAKRMSAAEKAAFKG